MKHESLWLLPDELGDAAKILFQDCGLGLKLMRIADVLVVAAAAVPEVRAVGLYPMRGRLQNRSRPASGKAALLLEQRSFDAFALQNKGYETALAGPCSSAGSRANRRRRIPVFRW